MKKSSNNRWNWFCWKIHCKSGFEEKHEVYLVVRSPQKAKALFGEKVKIFQIDDFTNQEKLRKILQAVNPQYVIHLIGIIQEKKRSYF